MAQTLFQRLENMALYRKIEQTFFNSLSKKLLSVFMVFIPHALLTTYLLWQLDDPLLTRGIGVGLLLLMHK